MFEFDMERIEELKALPSKEAKVALQEYAQETLGIKISRSKTTVTKMVEEMMDIADQRANGVEPVTSVAPPKVSVNVVSLTEPKPEVELPAAPEETLPPETAELYNEAMNLLDEVEEKLVTAAVAHEQATEDLRNFFPITQLIGKGPTAFIQAPYWVVDFILATPDWKAQMQTHKEKRWLKTIMYYIERNGSVNVRESRNSIVYNFR